MKPPTLSHCAVVPRRLKQLTLTAAAALVLALAPVATAATPTFEVLKNLDYSTTGIFPRAELLQGTDGALYGTTESGGSSEGGTVFKLNPDGSGFTVLKNFDYDTTGGSPNAALVQGADGALYGTATYGGDDGWGSGTVFKLNTDGSGFTVLLNFDYDTTGGSPYAALVQGADGALYGTTRDGGSSGGGTVFKLNPDGSGFTVLAEFPYYGGGIAGGHPTAGLVQGADGALYGTTSIGGSYPYGGGTVFKLNPDGSGFSVLYDFGDYTTGGQPRGTLVLGADGALYGTTESGGSSGGGTVFKLNTDGSGFTVLQNLNGLTTGYYPKAGLVQGADGTLYGTAAYGAGGGWGYGSVFKLNADGTGFTVLYEFAYDTITGGVPIAGLVQGADGALYGTTFQGGSSGYGTVFRLSFGPPAAPDLQVTALTTTNNQAPQGQKVTVTAVVTNTGTAAAGASTTIIMDGTTVLATVATPALGAGDSVTLTLDLRTAAQNGTHVLSVAADTANAVSESDEANNTRTLTVNIKGNQVR